MPRPAPDPAARAALAGLGWGLLAAVIWAGYSVLARLGVKAGLSPAEMSLLRFAPGALLTLPLLWRWGWRDLAGIGWRRWRMARSSRRPARCSRAWACRRR